MMENRLTLDTSFQDINQFNELIENWQNERVTAIIFESSGSTGSPQEMRLSKDMIRASIQRSANAFHWAQEKVLISLPIDKTGGKMMVLRALELGWDGLVMNPTSNPVSMLHDDHSFSQISLTPFQLGKCLESVNDLKKLKRFRTILVGGGPMSGFLYEAIREHRWFDRQLIHTYGMTETASHVAWNDLAGWTIEFRVMPGIEWGVNEDSELWFKDQYFETQTTDIADPTSRSSFIWLGRSDFTINTGGIKVQPEKLEERISGILRQAGINREIAITSEPDELLGRKLVLAIEGSMELDVQHIFKVLNQELPKHYVPKSLVFVDELPFTTSNKLNRIQLAQMV